MESEIQEIVCPVCMNVFRRPTTLSCGHTFCFACLLNATKEHRNCPMCRQHFACTPNKLKTDYSLATFIDRLRTAQKRLQATKLENIHIECKEENLLLIDILTEDLLLPYNRIVATFELQSNILIDRMERFVARQQIPFNKLAVVCRLVHVEQIRRNLYRGVIEGRAFSRIQSQNIESEVSLESDEEDFFYRTCKCKEISESSDSHPSEYSSFFSIFNKIDSNQLKTHVFHRIDPTIFTSKSDPIALFYSILGILSMENEKKYSLAISFDQEERIKRVKQFIKINEGRFSKNPSSIIRLMGKESGDVRVKILVLLLLLMLWMNKDRIIPFDGL